MVEDKKYLISESELKEFKAMSVWTHGFAESAEMDPIGRATRDFLKSKTPIEPSEDDKLFGKELQRGLEKAQMHGWEQGKKQVKTPYDFTIADETYIENIWKDLMSKLPQPKQFNEAEIREILENNITIPVFEEDLNEKYKSKTCIGKELDYDNAIKELSTLTPKAQGEVKKCQ